LNVPALIAAGVMALLGVLLLALNIWTTLLPGAWVYVPIPLGLAIGLTVVGLGFVQALPVAISFLASGLAFELLFRYNLLPHGA
jgi:hypothetical protein